jgi:tetratricopeptide (TPR) repeat protein
MAHFSEDSTAASMWATEALDLYRQLEDRSGVAEAAGALGVQLGEGGDWIAARPLIEESLELFRGLGDEVQVMWHTRTLAWAYSELGDLGRARPLYEDALRQARVAGNRLFESVVLGSLAWLAVAQQRVHDAPALMKESLRIQGDVGDPVQLAIGFAHAAQILTALGRPEPAVQLISSFEIQSEELGGAFPWVVRMNETTLRQIRAQLDPAVFTAAWQEGANLTSEKALSLALDALAAAS